MTISTLVDTDVLIDLVALQADPAQRAWSRAQFLAALDEGTVATSVIVWAEITQKEAGERRLRALFAPFDLQEEPLPFEAAFQAGQAHRLYRKRGGQRERTLPDFLIGAHALVAGHRLLTRDGARYRGYFPDLRIICPETHP